MFTKIHKRMKSQKGFTLIELLVVIIIIAILAAIAIPTFLGQRQKAQDAAAKSLVRNAMTALESAYVDEHTYAVADTVVEAIEPSIDFVEAGGSGVCTTAPAVAATALATDAQVDYYGSDSTFEIASLSESDNVFGVVTDKGAGGSTVFVKNIGGTVTEGW
jgi:type IV pilus assembly protein PilA